jgi:hypothetical protein
MRAVQGCCRDFGLQIEEWLLTGLSVAVVS